MGRGVESSDMQEGHKKSEVIKGKACASNCFSTGMEILKCKYLVVENPSDPAFSCSHETEKENIRGGRCGKADYESPAPKVS